MKTILIPTDFSECANNAVIVAFEMAKKAKATLHFIHFLKTPVEWKKLRKEQEKNFPETLHEIGKARAALTNLETKAKKLKLKIQTTLVFDNGDISELVNNYKADFIVVGSHGTKGFKEIIGSNAQRIVRYAKSPVLVVKQEPKNLNFKKLVFASTFEEEVHQPFLKIIAFAALFKAQIHLLYVNMPFQFKETDEIEAQMQRFLKKCPKGTCTINIYNALNEERGIQKFSEKISSDIIALTTHGKTGFVKMIAPSITESLVNHSESLILSVNINSK